MPKRDIIRFDNHDEARSVGTATELLTTTSRRRCKGAKLHSFIDCNTSQGTGVLGFTELIDELEAIALLPQDQRNVQLQELSQRKGLSVVRLCHLSAVIRMHGGAA